MDYAAEIERHAAEHAHRMSLLRDELDEIKHRTVANDRAAAQRAETARRGALDASAAASHPADPNSPAQSDSRVAPRPRPGPDRESRTPQPEPDSLPLTVPAAEAPVDQEAYRSAAVEQLAQGSRSALELSTNENRPVGEPSSVSERHSARDPHANPLVAADRSRPAPHPSTAAADAEIEQARRRAELRAAVARSAATRRANEVVEPSDPEEPYYRPRWT
ncbi:hypothetical protein NRB56_06310 [Nocardia sp. RB56]|uniref:Uncharacterized protein n=1 Tax=Nocardia aurantia TaxID=2585199 RepID=A0A7K0DHE5_9NOCA|nr:hypothetical protein [Nocardia aurantia]